MELRLSRNSPTNCILKDGQGRPRYQIATPFQWSRKVTTISRFMPGRGAPSGERAGDAKGGRAPDAGIHLMGLPDERVAQIEWHTVRHTKFNFGVQEVDSSRYLPKKGLFGRQRTFVGMDGRPYKWSLGQRTCSLELNDGSKTPVARFHRRSFGIVGKAHNGYLEIMPQGMPIVDDVVVTFVYVEKRRERQQQAATNSAINS